MLAPLLADWRERPQRTWSVIVTLFGDAIVPRGGSVWLGTLLAACAAMDIDAGAVRTALSRLVADGWTERRRVGRHSYYRLAAQGSAPFTQAAARIYAAAPPPWDGRFHCLLAPPDRAAAEQAGYGQALPGLFVSTQATASAPVVLWATPEPQAARALAAMAWPLDRVARSFSRFVTVFAGVPDWTGASPIEALVARTLLIHDYRRIVLHAPALPLGLLPPDWPGTAARQLAASAYHALLPAAEAWLDVHGMAETGPLPPAGPELWRRFRA